MARVIGAAHEFYRLRVSRVDQTGEPDLEWRDDILYRQPPTERIEERESYAIEAVNLDDEDDVTRVALYDSPDAAHEALAQMAEDLAEMTNVEFRKAYLDIANSD